MDCIFCHIVAGQGPAFRIDADERTFTFLDLFPVARGHTLIVTRKHYANLYEADPDDLAAVIRQASRMAGAIKKTLAPDGLMAMQLNGAAAGQTVFHYHMHLIPRAQGDSLQIHSRIRGDDEDLERVSRQLAAALAST